MQRSITVLFRDEILPTSYPKPNDGYPIIQLKDTDASLPSDVRLQNNLRYAYFKTIANGGKCVIQSCKDLHLGRVVCFKKLHAEIADDPLEQMRFLREARVTAMLQHPNTAPVYELGRDSAGHYYFTMKLVVGSTLREILDKLREGDAKHTTAWDLERLIDVLLQVAQALDYAHSHGVIHRDIKPENIVAGPFGEVLLLDWGLAKVWNTKDGASPFDSSQKIAAQDSTNISSSAASDSETVSSDEDMTLTAKGPLQATPLYMSPEQTTNSPDIDYRTDIYSLGSVLFEILTLKHLAWGETLEEMLHHTRHTRPPTPSVVSPERKVPSTLDTLCSRCIQKDPDHRIQSIRELIVDLVFWKKLQSSSRPI